MIAVEVAYATEARQLIIPLQVKEYCTVELAIIQSGILEIFPEIDLKTVHVGIFSEITTLSHPLKDGDRVEIYRSLLVGPEERRQQRRNSASRRERPFTANLK